MHRRSLLKRWLSVLPLVAAVAAPSAWAANPTVIRIGSPELGSGDKGFPGAGPLAVARAKGWLEEEFKKDGIKVEWTFFRAAGPAVNEAVSAKQLDVVFLGDLAGVIGKARGLPTRLIVPSGRNSNSYLAVAPGAGIQSFADLKGKKVSVLKGTAYQRPFNRLLADAGLKEKDVRIINMDWPTSKAAVVGKDIDATFGGADLHLLKDKGVTLPASTKGKGPSYGIQAAVIATQDFIDQYPEATGRLVKQIVRASHWASEEANREALIQLFTQASGNPEVVFRAELEGESLKANFSPRFDEAYLNAYKSVVAEGLKQSLIRNPVDVEAWIEPRFVNQALKDLKLESHWPLYDSFGNARPATAPVAKK